MIVLAVDTCLEPGSLALLQADESSSATATENMPEVVALPPGWRSVALHEEILRLLDRHSLSTSDIDLYAVTAGPGAFTGVRLGLTAVKGLAEVHGKPVVPVSTLEALSATAHQSRDRGRAASSTSSLVTAFAPVLDARRGQVFGAVYAVQGEGLRLILPETVCALGSFLQRIKAAGLTDVRFCATDWTPFLAEMERAGWGADSLVRVSPQLAGTVALMGLLRFRQGQGTDALVAGANYVRASDAELFWKE